MGRRPAGLVVVRFAIFGGASVLAPAPPERLRRREGASRLVSLAPNKLNQYQGLGDGLFDYLSPRTTRNTRTRKDFRVVRVFRASKRTTTKGFDDLTCRRFLVSLDVSFYEDSGL